MTVVDIQKERLKKLIASSCKHANLSAEIGVKLFTNLCDFLEEKEVPLSSLDNGEIAVLGFVMNTSRTLNEIADLWGLKKRKDLEDLATRIHLLEEKKLVKTYPVLDKGDESPADWLVETTQEKKETVEPIKKDEEPKPNNVLEFKKK